jgi:hypothetical protein
MSLAVPAGLLQSWNSLYHLVNGDAEIALKHAEAYQKG